MAKSLPDGFVSDTACIHAKDIVCLLFGAPHKKEYHTAPCHSIKNADKNRINLSLAFFDKKAQKWYRLMDCAVPQTVKANAQ
jgi:hypothetical protein